MPGRCEAGTRRGRRCKNDLTTSDPRSGVSLCSLHATRRLRGMPVSLWLLSAHDEAHGIDSEREGRYTSVAVAFHQEDTL